jgi:hypothetical protein
MFLESTSSIRFITLIVFSFLDCLTLEYGTDGFPETSVNNLRQVISQKSEDLGVKKVIAMMYFHVSFN